MNTALKHNDDQIQTILVPKKKYTKQQAIKELKKEFKNLKNYDDFDEKPNYWRVRQIDPKECDQHYHSFKNPSNGIIIVYCHQR